MNAHGTAHKYGDHVDTDVIIPAGIGHQDPKELPLTAWRTSTRTSPGKTDPATFWWPA